MLKKPSQLRRRTSPTFRVYKEFDNHEFIIGFTDEETGLKGYIAIHNTNLGPALGGTRLQAYPNEEAALRDALNLSKAMTYKCALSGLPWGGGKAVIMHDSGLDRKAVLTSYARFVEKLGGLFKTGTDVGIQDEDVQLMAKFTKHMLGVSEGDRGDLSTSKMAALGVYYSIRSALNHVYGNDSAKGKRIGIKGVGKLGGELARLLHEDGAELIIADIDEEKTKKLKRSLSNITVVSPATIHQERLDVFSPCALGGEIRPRTIKELNTKIIAGGANNQLSDERSGDQLYDRQILFAPDYIANAGGLIYVADELEKDGFKKARVLKRVKGIQVTLDEVFALAAKKKVGAHRVADEIAFARFSKAK